MVLASAEAVLRPVDHVLDRKGVQTPEDRFVSRRWGSQGPVSQPETLRSQRFEDFSLQLDPIQGAPRTLRAQRSTRPLERHGQYSRVIALRIVTRDRLIAEFGFCRTSSPSESYAGSLS
jgi:hypothetical protein